MLARANIFSWRMKTHLGKPRLRGRHRYDPSSRRAKFRRAPRIASRVSSCAATSSPPCATACAFAPMSIYPRARVGCRPLLPATPTARMRCSWAWRPRASSGPARAMPSSARMFGGGLPRKAHSIRHLGATKSPTASTPSSGLRARPGRTAVSACGANPTTASPRIAVPLGGIGRLNASRQATRRRSTSTTLSIARVRSCSTPWAPGDSAWRPGDTVHSTDSTAGRCRSAQSPTPWHSPENYSNSGQPGRPATT